jgi:hypothetical protein
MLLSTGIPDPGPWLRITKSEEPPKSPLIGASVQRSSHLAADGRGDGLGAKDLRPGERLFFQIPGTSRLASPPDRPLSPRNGSALEVAREHGSTTAGVKYKMRTTP